MYFTHSVKIMFKMMKMVYENEDGDNINVDDVKDNNEDGGFVDCDYECYHKDDNGDYYYNDEI